MPINQDLPATDSAKALHELVGDDATATFENDPKFIDSDPTIDSSSENLQTRTDREDVRGLPDVQVKGADVDDDDEDEDEDLDDEDLDDEDDDLDDDDDEDEDE